MYATHEHAVEKMPYDWRIHDRMTALKMGMRNFEDSGELEIGDHVTNQHGGGDEFIGEVIDPNGGRGHVMVRWLSDDIRTHRVVAVPRPHLVKADYAPPREFDERPHGGNGSTAWLLNATAHGWHVGGNYACSPAQLSSGYDGWIDAWLQGTKVSIRFNAAGEITWSRIISDCMGQAYASVKHGKGAGRIAMMWVTPGP